MKDRIMGVIILNDNDNVATATLDLSAGRKLQLTQNDKVFEVVLQQDIPGGHKFALFDMPTDTKVIKYGEVIGIAVADIKAGEHVHVHNVKSLRGGATRK
jgi:altronate dehydratase small subunit